MAYADRTTVPVEKTKTEIEATLVRYGAARFAYLVEPKGAVIIFEAHDRRLRFDLPLPAAADGRAGGAKAERQRRQRWRALLLCIKAKLESVASNIETFEEAFLAHVVMGDGRTVYERTRGPIEIEYHDGRMQPLLPGPHNAAEGSP